MRQLRQILGRLTAAFLATLLLVAPHAAFAKAKHKHPTSKKSTKKSSTHSSSKKSSKKLKRSRHKGSWKRHGQQAVDARRTQQIQEALVQSHYLDGEPSGAWDSQTQEALRRYQAANGWQTKVVPDSRALIKLGLGPSTEKLLNPESAMTSRMDASKISTPSVAAPAAVVPGTGSITPQ